MLEKIAKLAIGDEIAVIGAKEEVKMGTVIENNRSCLDMIRGREK